jgi:hypothetical protein
MKRTLLLLTALAAVGTANAQEIKDTVKLGAGYANQVWYSLANDEQASKPKAEWDIAFEMNGGASAAILANTSAGVVLYKYPKGDVSAWATVDTTGMSGWTKRYNSDTSWAKGAIGRYKNVNDPYDMDWGKYNVTTHIVTGDSIFIIKTAGGQYKKLIVKDLTSGVYNIRYADLNGSNQQDKSITKATYASKNFVYYALQTDLIIDREPAAEDWDLVFTQFARSQDSYNVTGVLQNKLVKAVRVDNVPNKETYNNYAAHTLTTPINILGADWKTFNGSTYTIKDSSVYFVQDRSGDIWKVRFTGFDMVDGGFMLAKENLTKTPTGINEVAAKANAQMVLYPNPAAQGRQVTVVYNSARNMGDVKLSVFDISGKMVYSESRPALDGLQQYAMPVNNLGNGMYIVTLEAGATRIQQKLVIQ